MIDNYWLFLYILLVILAAPEWLYFMRKLRSSLRVKSKEWD